MMKDLLIYMNPSKRFDSGHSKTIKMQIDNCNLWKRDVTLITNFPYSYGGVEAVVFPDNLFNTVLKMASKIDVICEMYDRGMIKGDWWFRDIDAFQQGEVDVKPEVFAICTGGGRRLSAGSFFFNEKAEGIFKKNKELVYKLKCTEEDAFMMLKDDKYEILNNAYNFGVLHIKRNLCSLNRNIAVVHFHPTRRKQMEKMYPYVCNKLLEIIERHL